MSGNSGIRCWTVSWKNGLNGCGVVSGVWLLFEWSVIVVVIVCRVPSSDTPVVTNQNFLLSFFSYRIRIANRTINVGRQPDFQKHTQNNNNKEKQQTTHKKDSNKVDRETSAACGFVSGSRLAALGSVEVA